MKVFLDIEIGDRGAYDRELNAYRVTADYLRLLGSQVIPYLPRPAMMPPMATDIIGTIIRRIACSTAYTLPLRA